MVTNAAADAQAAACEAIAKNGEVVEAAFVQALGRQGLSDGAQHALVLTTMSVLLHDDAKEASTHKCKRVPFS